MRRLGHQSDRIGYIAADSLHEGECAEYYQGDGEAPLAGVVAM